MSLIYERANARNTIPSQAETAPITVVIAGEPVAKGRPRMTRRRLRLYPGGNPEV